MSVQCCQALQQVWQQRGQAQELAADIQGRTRHCTPSYFVSSNPHSGTCIIKAEL